VGGRIQSAAGRDLPRKIGNRDLSCSLSTRETGLSISLGALARLAQANEAQPIPENRAVAPFLEVRAGRFTARERKKRSFLRSEGRPPSKLSRPVPKTRATPHWGSSNRARSGSTSPPSLSPRCFGPDGEEICGFDFRALRGADSAYENILFFASACRSGRARRASRSRRCHGTGSGRKFVLKRDLMR
jgi:hypothetical protein